MKIILLMMFVLVAYAENAPVGYLKDSDNARTPVYDFYDEVSGKRFLVIMTPRGVAMIEANPMVKPPEPVKVVVPIVKPRPELEYWERSRTYSYTKAMLEVGWELESMANENGSRVYFLRRKNPGYEGPPLENLPLEKNK